MPSGPERALAAGIGSSWERAARGRPRMVCIQPPSLAEDGWPPWLRWRSVIDLAKMAFKRASCLETIVGSKLIRVVGTNVASEEGFQQSREIGLDAYEACTWQGWYDDSASCLRQQAFLAVTRVTVGDHVNGG